MLPEVEDVVEVDDVDSSYCTEDDLYKVEGDEEEISCTEYESFPQDLHEPRVQSLPQPTMNLMNPLSIDIDPVSAHCQYQFYLAYSEKLV